MNIYCMYKNFKNSLNYFIISRDHYPIPLSGLFPPIPMLGSPFISIPGSFPIPIPAPLELYIFSDIVISASVFPPLIVLSEV